MRGSTGSRRAAAFLMSLEKGAAAKVLEHLDESVLIDVVEAMAQAGEGSAGEASLRTLYEEVLAGGLRMHGVQGARLRSREDLRALLQSALGPEQAGCMFERIHQQLLRERPFLALERASARSIAAALAPESDVVIALVLAHLDPALAAGVLGELDRARAIEIVRRMASSSTPASETLIPIARELSERVKSIAAAPSGVGSAPGLEAVVRLLQFTEPQVEHALMQGLDAPLAAEIRDLRFTWTDLADVEPRSMQKILSSIDIQTLAIALKGCSPEVEENLMANLSTRVQDMVREDREVAGPLPMSDVLAAREQLLQAVRGLMDTGEFRPARAGDDLVV
jgi:flagellar motor switch protein FliG